MKDFGFMIPQNCQFGMGALKKLPDFLKLAGCSKVMLISDRMLEELGVVGKVRDILAAGGLDYAEYLDVVGNPTTDIVKACGDKYVAEKCDGLLAVGGGSPMDVAKAVGVVAKFGGDIGDYEGVGKVPGKIDTLICVPTTAGTGSEVTVAAVITDTKRNYKLSVLGPQISPDYAVLDPELIMTAPASVAAACGVDALIHAMESYINTDANPFSKAMAEAAMSLIGGNIRAFVGNRKNADAACAMMLGSCLAGIAFANNRLGDIHAMSHPVSAFFNVPHGVANAVLMPKIFEFNAICADERYAKIYEYVTGKKAGEDFVPQMCCDALAQLNADLGIPAHFADVKQVQDRGGAARFEELIPQMAIDAMKSGNVTVNPRATTVKDVEALYAQVK
ncbi:MAG: iron-containing alcohol dehydrogenase [Abditibacteriota bacterium]|nr:iron-containing alcohol dehydrogenase [Abditibacteriota bacterium]